ncbi:MAG: SprB repeat-containing protein [Bacteroidetes bacterium]|nr:SprB repeat-containing protein [Bacteroidota bacterium]
MNNSNNSNTISVLPSGVYSLTITDANLCTRIRVANVSNLGAPVIALDSLRDVRCFNGATGGIFISVSGGVQSYSYLWSNGALTQDLNNVIAGPYTVTVTDFNNCQVIFDTIVSQPLLLNDSIQVTNASCGLLNGALTAFPFGGTLPYTYLSE